MKNIDKKLMELAYIEMGTINLGISNETFSCEEQSYNKGLKYIKNKENKVCVMK